MTRIRAAVEAYRVLDLAARKMESLPRVSSAKSRALGLSTSEVLLVFERVE